MQPQLVQRTDRDGIAIVELHRPERRNAVTGPLLDELAAVFTAVEADDSVEAVVLCGSEGAFCSGIDLKEYNADPAPDWLAEAPMLLRRAHVAIAKCEAPVVVALERYAINGGAAFALAGDQMIVGAEAWLQVGEVRQGLPAAMNLAWLAARYPPVTVSRVLTMGRRIVGAELVSMGIADEVVADDMVRSRAEEVAAEIASFPPGAGRANKRAMRAMGGIADPDAWFERAAAAAPMPDQAVFQRADES